MEEAKCSEDVSAQCLQAQEGQAFCSRSMKGVKPIESIDRVSKRNPFLLL